MYLNYFGLTEAPFSIAVNPRYLFMSRRHRDALAHLLYGVGAGGAFIVLTGEVGTGKTTLTRCLLEQLPGDADVASILNPALDARELLASVCDELAIETAGAGHSLKALSDRLHRFLLDNHARRRRTILLIDEAQHLSFEVLEQIRLLTNLETDEEKLLHIILIGQPELGAMLSRRELRQLNQRVTARYDLGPLSREETFAYIRHRLSVAGVPPDRELFPPRLVRAIHRRSNGVPRLINLLCDRLLLGAYGRRAARPSASMLSAAIREVLGQVPERRWPLPAAVAVACTAVLATVFLWPAARDAGPAAPVPRVGSAAAASSPDRVEAAAEVPAPVAQPFLLPPGQAFAELWRLYSDRAPPTDPCAAEPGAELRCEVVELGSWDALRRMDRPLLLAAVTPEGFGSAIVLLDVAGDRASVVSVAGRVLDVGLAQLAEAWTGTARFLWRPPRGFERPLGPGAEGAVVARVARLFSRLDGQLEPLAGRRWTPEFGERVRLFQAAEGLATDGWVGANTLQYLNLRLGIDPDCERALAARRASPGGSA